MFDDILSLEKERTSKQALGFYLAYFFMGLSFGALLGLLNYMLGTGFPPEYVGVSTGVLLHSGLSFGIVYEKGLKGLGPMMVILFSAIISIPAGLLGLLLPTYLSTLKKN